MKVLVVGDSCKDKFIYGECKRICPEAPVPVFNPINRTENGGMAKNVYNNLKSLAPDWNIKLLTNDTKIEKTRLVDIKTNQMLLRVDENDQCERIKNIEEIGKFDVVIISDYNKGFLQEEDIEKLVNLYPISFIDTKKIFGEWINNASFIKINETEFENNESKISNLRLKGELLITLGEKGVRYKNTILPPPRQAEVSDLSGAGDTFFAAFIFQLLNGSSLIESINYAQECALEVIEKKGVVII